MDQISLQEVLEQIDTIAENYIQNETHKIKAKDTGLDERIGYIYINDEAIYVPSSKKGTIDYYGGFEYVDKDYVFNLGRYVGYMREEDRVDGHISEWENKTEAETENKS